MKNGWITVIHKRHVSRRSDAQNALARTSQDRVRQGLQYALCAVVITVLSPRYVPPELGPKTSYDSTPANQPRMANPSNWQRPLHEQQAISYQLHLLKQHCLEHHQLLLQAPHAKKPRIKTKATISKKGVAHGKGQYPDTATLLKQLQELEAVIRARDRAQRVRSKRSEKARKSRKRKANEPMMTGALQDPEPESKRIKVEEDPPAFRSHQYRMPTPYLMPRIVEEQRPVQYH